jgi:L-seryl-tRNA(Ser) seleniumtransferase
MVSVAKGSGSSAVSPESFREIPSVADAAAHLERVVPAVLSPSASTTLVQQALGRARAQIAGGATMSRAQILQQLEDEAKALQRSRLEPSLNATGIMIHTNLGRAPVSRATAEAMAFAAAAYVPLEIDPESNRRGGRMDELTGLMRLLTGAEATLVVNNNAAAVLLTLSALASGREVIVSRSEAVEIGGGFRIPDVMRQSGATLVEVGTTNRTYARDYQNAITERTAAILTVHQSNFHIQGFTARPAIGELVALGRGANVPVVSDLGSGALLDVSRFGLAAEPTVQESISAGISIVTASGDKLLGGPQAGVICGTEQFVLQIAGHPLSRAVRADKTCLAGLAVTLRHYVQSDAEQQIPVWRMISVGESKLCRRAEQIASQLPNLNDSLEVVPAESTSGGGSLPGEILPSWALSIGGLAGGSVNEVALRLRTGQPRVFGRIHENRLLLDLRTVLPEDDERLIAAITAATTAH